jgi:hypothetical protein
MLDEILVSPLHFYVKHFHLLHIFLGYLTTHITLFFFLIFAPCILLSSKSIIYPQMHFISVLENIKIYIKTYIKIVPTCFRLRPPSGSLHVSLAKVTFIKSVKVRRYGLCGCVAACYIKSMVVCVLCAVQIKILI